MNEDRLLEQTELFHYGSPASIALLVGVAAAMLLIVVGTHVVSSYLRVHADRTAHWVPCLRCRRQIPPETEACPHCGRLRKPTLSQQPAAPKATP